MDSLLIVGQLQELIQNVRKAKDEYDGKARNWAIVITSLEKVLAYVKVYCVEDEDAN